MPTPADSRRGKESLRFLELLHAFNASGLSSRLLRSEGLLVSFCTEHRDHVARETRAAP